MVVLKRISAHAAGGIPMPSSVPPGLADLLESLLVPEAKDRKGFAGVKSSAWFADFNWGLLVSSDLPSPLRARAADQLAQRSAGGPLASEMDVEAELQCELAVDLSDEEEQDLAWLEFFAPTS